MKYELIKKILNSPITILDYLILEHIQNNTTDIFLKYISYTIPNITNMFLWLNVVDRTGQISSSL